MLRRYHTAQFTNVTDLHNLRPRVFFSGKSSYEIYYEFPYTFAKYPIFPFGSIIMDNIPMSTQTYIVAGTFG